MRIGRSGGRDQSRPPESRVTSAQDVHVVPHPDGWAVERSRASRPSGVYISRRFAVNAGREHARRDSVELLVFDADRQLNFRESYRGDEPFAAHGSRRFRPSRRPRAGPDSTGMPAEHGVSTTTLMHVVVPYDSWCLRIARHESERVLEALCTPDLLDELLVAITELMLHATLRTRNECTLTLDHIDNQILVVVRGTARRAEDDRRGALGTVHSLSDGHEVGHTVGGECVWVSFTLDQ